MTRLRFVHAADLHLDSPFIGLMTVAPEVATDLREATFAAYDAIIDLCIRERADALMVAGDIYDGADRSLRAQLKFVEGLRRLDAAGIRSFVCHGNHDPLDGWEARLTLPDSCHRFGPKVESVPFDPADPERAIVYGISYPKREVRDNLVPSFGQAEPGMFSIGLLHCNVGGNPDHEAYAPCTLDDLTRTRIDYWALGHVHTRQVLREMDPTVVYPGNPQGRHPKEAGARGVYLVDVSDSGQVTLDFRVVDMVRWEVIELGIDSLETEQQLLDLTNECVESGIGQADGRHLVYRLLINGCGPLHQSVRRRGVVEDMQRQINERFSLAVPFAWCERVEVSTAVPFDREERRQARDFISDLLRLIDETGADQGLLDEMRTELDPLFEHHRVRRHLKVKPTNEEMRALLAEAETRCLQELLREDMS